MAGRRSSRSMRHSRMWIWGAALVAVVMGAGYYIASINTQPSLISDDGADLVTPEEVEDRALNN
jgi:Ni,Fe-hydrogenase I cytochrome b subunit